MKYKLLGKSGLRVSELCLGTNTFGLDWGFGADKQESKQIFDAFAKEGGNFIDTANFYTESTSEKYLGDFLQKDRDYFVVGTKYTFSMNLDDPNAGGNQRKNMLRSVEASLKRLKTDYIDLFWLHVWDFTTPVDEVMRGLDDLVRQGKINYIGVSDTPAWVISKSNMLAELRGWTQFVAMQMEYNLTERTMERDLLPMAKDAGMSTLAWGAVAGGLLTGKYAKKDKEGRLKEGNPRLSERNLAIAEKLVQVADKVGKPPVQVALNWMRQQDTSIIPIIGSKNAAQLKENLACLDFEIPEAEMTALNDLSAIEMGFPHDFFPRAKSRIFGNRGTDFF